MGNAMASFSYLQIAQQPIQTHSLPLSCFQQYIREPNGWEISPADGSSISEGANLEQLRIKHAPNTAFLTATATSGLLASSQAPGRLHFSVPSLARPSFVSMLGFPGSISPLSERECPRMCIGAAGQASCLAICNVLACKLLLTECEEE